MAASTVFFTLNIADEIVERRPEPLHRGGDPPPSRALSRRVICQELFLCFATEPQPMNSSEPVLAVHISELSVWKQTDQPIL